MGFQTEGHNVIQTIGPWLSLATMAAIVVYAVFEKAFTKRLLFNALLFSLVIYHFMATTVNPWYLTPLLAFAVFTNYRFVFVWSALIPLTYIAFATEVYQDNLWIVAFEYAVVYLWLAGEVFNKSNWGVQFRDWHIRKRAEVKTRRIKPWLEKGSRILDVGSGNGGVCKLLSEREVEVTALDVKNKSFYKEIEPVIYDGNKMPFDDGAFEKVTVLTVLHHCKNPEQVLAEAIRVADKEVLLIEDVYKNPFQKYLTFFTDSLVNNEWFRHPHTNKTEKQWEALFKELNIEVVEKQEHRVLFFFRQVTYRLKK